MRALIFVLALVACRGGHDTRAASAPDRPRDAIALTYLGVAGWQLDAGPVTLLVDPYYSRPDLDGPIVPDPAAIAAHAPPRADAIVIGHSHVDHVLDAPAVAAATGARLIGSESTARLARASGLPATQIVAVRGRERIAGDGWSVQVLPSLHSKIGDEHLGGQIAAEPQLPMRFAEYAEGGTFAYLVEVAGRRVLFLGTANFIEAELTGLRPDIAVIATGLREKVDDYTCRLLRALGRPPLVYTNHFDDWRGPPVDAPLDEDLSAFVAEVERCAPGTRVVVPRHFERIESP
ncbi:MBL fold metallo-hydrolase [Nannocystis bainbridge]|uniref:MBL fold metallo-hydrolase n=1 Tax=Nannocystis bainbridge TaxID=2995303 RepID=A0ABT5ECU3_9BACT|nr:MBL fold metallo-hydrolase [Nannocystis bainbridge]MDC0723694.1 MBL fold metallo-hydrolase [Nannocystis bainbridge]